ncbi:hypothetical protein [Promicromonospora kroppenstedtii]|uniref:hypothetical protein n=1 Tax=Promicromonospora kroppenstedtii TaxID=440482 RepID=UPI0004B0E1D9|nr:hypothetical protein [Promicromonospora kroppenstedtii]
MQELVGRLTALDPEASESLKVVAYFDVLVAGGVGIPALLRGAAVLSGAVAGAVVGQRTYRVGPDGGRLPEGAVVGPAAAPAAPAATTSPPEQRLSRPVADGRVWIERAGSAHANDDMVVERLALAVDLVRARHDGESGSSLATLIDETRDVGERRIALSRLRLDPARAYRVAALPASRDVAAAPSGTVSGAVSGTASASASGTASGAPSTVVATPDGLVRAVVLGRDTEITGPAGLGLVQPADRLAESFRTALLALRLSSGSGAVVDAEDLGVVLAAVEALEPVAAQQPDVVALARLDARTRAVLDELAAAESVRAGASALGVHHSTLQARHDALTTELGYDPRSLQGRTRFQLARLLLRLTEAHPVG